MTFEIETSCKETQVLSLTLKRPSEMSFKASISIGVTPNVEKLPFTAARMFIIVFLIEWIYIEEVTEKGVKFVWRQLL